MNWKTVVQAAAEASQAEQMSTGQTTVMVGGCFAELLNENGLSVQVLAVEYNRHLKSTEEEVSFAAIPVDCSSVAPATADNRITGQGDLSESGGKALPAVAVALNISANGLAENHSAVELMYCFAVELIADCSSVQSRT